MQVLRLGQGPFRAQSGYPSRTRALPVLLTITLPCGGVRVQESGHKQGNRPGIRASVFRNTNSIAAALASTVPCFDFQPLTPEIRTVRELPVLLQVDLGRCPGRLHRLRTCAYHRARLTALKKHPRAGFCLCRQPDCSLIDFRTRPGFRKQYLFCPANSRPQGRNFAPPSKLE